MALTRKPAINEARLGDRTMIGVVSNVRQRIEALEALIDTLEKQANQTTFSLSRTTASTANIQQLINQLRETIEELADLLAGDDGIVVVSDGQLVVRELEPGTGITITNGDGADGNPVISATAECCYPFLTTELDDDILTEDDHRIRVE